MTSLGSYAGYWAIRRGDREAVVCGDARLDWATFHARIEATAATMQALGAKTGDRIGILLDNCLEWPIAYLAIWRIGCIVVPLNPRFGEFELRAIEADAECTLIVSTPRIATLLGDKFAFAGGAPDDVWMAPLATADGKAPVSIAEAFASAAAPEPVLLEGEAPAAIFYTSGSTGLPKGTIHTHASIQACFLGSVLACGYNCEDRGLALAPLAFTGTSLCTLTPMLLAGACSVIEKTFDAARALKTIVDERISYLSVVPAIWDRMPRLPDFEQADFSSIRFANVGGAPCPTELITLYAKRGLAIRQVCGCTEGGGLTGVPTVENAVAEPQYCGPVLMALESRVVDEQGHDLPAGTVGELWIKGAQVMTGYWRNEKATAEAFVDGWYRTGDLAKRDAEGSLSLVDRMKNMIISGGTNIYPAEIERAMMSIDGVLDVGVFGMPDPQWGERTVGLVNCVDTLDADMLRDTMRRLVGAMKCPREIIVLEEPLPRTVTNKIARNALRGLYDQHLQTMGAVAS